MEDRRQETEGVLRRDRERLLLAVGGDQGRLQPVTTRLQAQLDVLPGDQAGERRGEEIRPGDDARPGTGVERRTQVGGADVRSLEL